MTWGWASALGGLAILAAVLSPGEARAEDTELRDRIIIACVGPPVAALVGGGFLIAGKLYGDGADEKAATLASKGYRDPCAAEPGTCKKIDHDLEAVDDANIGAVASFATAGTLAIVGVALVVDTVTKHKGSKSASFQIVPVVGHDVGGVVAGFHF